MGRQYVRLTKETTYNTFPTSPAGGTQVDLFLPTGNAMTIRPEAKFWEIRDAGVGNRLTQRNRGRTTVGGSITTYLFPSQAAYLLALAADLGSGTCLDLGSFSVDNAIVRDYNCGIDYRRYTGCKIAKLALSADMSDQGCLWTAKIDVIGSRPATITGTDFPTPLLSAYPAEDPYLFYQSAGHLSIGSTRSNYQSLAINIDNTLKSFADESLYVGAVDWFGRTISLDAKLRMKSQADRLLYEAGTKEAVSLELDNGTNTITFNFGGNVIIDSVGDDMPLDDYYTYMLHLTALMDSTLSPATDLTITTT